MNYFFEFAFFILRFQNRELVLGKCSEPLIRFIKRKVEYLALAIQYEYIYAAFRRISFSHRNFFHSIRLEFIYSRCVEEFNQIYKYALFTLFVWLLLSLSSSLAATQFLLVEYFKRILIGFQEET